MPCDYSRYPKDWKQIRERILSRAGRRCEKCGVPDRAWRRKGTDEVLSQLDYAKESAHPLFREGRFSRIVLTIAHVTDPDPMNCADGNLAAWCQRCHNRHDTLMRQSNAARTRARKKVQGELLEVGGGS